MCQRMISMGFPVKNPCFAIWAAVVFGKDSMKRPITGKKRIQCYDAIVRHWWKLQEGKNKWI